MSSCIRAHAKDARNNFVQINLPTQYKLCASIVSMKKQDLIKHLGKTVEDAALMLDFAHRNSVQRYPDELTNRQCRDVIRRMKANGIAYPKKWNL